MEHYGDIHLHYDGYPELSTHSNTCKWSATGRAPYEQYVPEEPLYESKCHVEYCHPGSWQGGKNGASPSLPLGNPKPMMAPQQHLLPSNLFGINMSTMYYAGAGILLAMLVLYFLRKRGIIGK